MTDMLLEEERAFQNIGETSHYPYALEKKLYQAILEGNLEEIENLGYAYSTYSPSVLCRNNSLRSLKNNLICNCTVVTRIAIEAGLDEKYAFFLSDLYINKIESLHQKETLLNLNSVMIFDFISHTKNSVATHMNNYAPLTQKIIKYVSKNLYKNFSLKDVANHVNANSSYLSRMFKKDVGMSFTQYIHTNRIKKAQHLILFSNLSLIEISTKLGYTTQSHFSKTFKQITGITPNQFKQNQKSHSLLHEPSKESKA
ncbi:AraC family transcriptional regulator [Vallitalea pronyensis]|uniref:AraC family transcriptional regulator n=1 Tax=Vallitalea pronyensis TaxID=1348613 RepID=A0A8J8SIP8_9FIRM|nr:helix-turn-helix domain-containing protein [Vallitalea pronyensis]QUI24733.1 AraC family transcriptional regulator [Vallitalea pronyensis]